MHIVSHSAWWLLCCVLSPWSILQRGAFVLVYCCLFPIRVKKKGQYRGEQVDFRMGTIYISDKAIIQLLFFK